MTTAGQRIEIDERSEPRQPVLYRTRLTDAAGAESLATVVDVSPNGFMARCDAPYAPGDMVKVALPRIGRVGAEVRWALGGRIGCRLHCAIGIADYHALLQTLPRG